MRACMRRARLLGYEPVQVDRLVSYPLVFFIYLSYNLGFDVELGLSN